MPDTIAQNSMTCRQRPVLWESDIESCQEIDTDATTTGYSGRSQICFIRTVSASFRSKFRLIGRRESL